MIRFAHNSALLVRYSCPKKGKIQSYLYPQTGSSQLSHPIRTTGPPASTRAQARTGAPRPAGLAAPAPHCIVTSTNSDSMILRLTKSPPGPHLDQHSDKEVVLQLQVPENHHEPTANFSSNSPLPNLRQQSPASSKVLPSITMPGLQLKSAKPCPGTALRGHSSAAHRVPQAVHTPVPSTCRPPRSTSQPHFSQGWPAGSTDEVLTRPSTPPGHPGPGANHSPAPQCSEGLKAQAGRRAPADRKIDNGRGATRPQEPQGPRGAATRSSCRTGPPEPHPPPAPRSRRHQHSRGSSPSKARERAEAKVKPARANQVSAPASITAAPHQSCHWGSPMAPLRSPPAGDRQQDK
ncbi:hypothetical protein NDU88_002365 [Pleurodeles waltl]|uniref:Uncharacterized protein n=1 Tax=Pleurodeles waltl TaxID=8319 RepID=A0AAV7UYM7_PLEWA|nr:hypothetical protein NDU88_002365 [Pleurodeles waltl]